MRWISRSAFSEITLLVLTAMLSAVPVALAATFTLAAALGARTLALKGVLLTRLSALHEAATIDVLCCDKTGTLTLNELSVEAVRAVKPGYDAGDVIGFAALASSADGQIRSTPPSAGCRKRIKDAGDAPLTVTNFKPFDPATKMAEATAMDGGREIRIIKGAPAVVGTVAPISAGCRKRTRCADRAGYRTLAVAAGPEGALELIGFIAFGDPPRPDSAKLLGELRSLGVRPVMVTGDAATTAAAVAKASGSTGRSARPETFPTALGQTILPSMPVCCPNRNSSWSRPFSARATPSACAATAPMTRRRYARRKWVSRCRPRPTWPRRRPGSC